MTALARRVRLGARDQLLVARELGATPPVLRPAARARRGARRVTDTAPGRGQGRAVTSLDIGIAFDLRSDFADDPDGPDDALEEYESEETIAAIAGALERA